MTRTERSAHTEVTCPVKLSQTRVEIRTLAVARKAD